MEIGWIAAIVVGGIAGWLAEQFMKSSMGLLDEHRPRYRRGRCCQLAVQPSRYLIRSRLGRLFDRRLHRGGHPDFCRADGSTTRLIRAARLGCRRTADWARRQAFRSAGITSRANSSIECRVSVERQIAERELANEIIGAGLRHLLADDLGDGLGRAAQAAAVRQIAENFGGRGCCGIRP